MWYTYFYGYQCDNEIESEEEVNKIEFSSSEDENLRYIAPTAKKETGFFSVFEPESDLDAIDTSSDKDVSAEKADDGTLWETLNEKRLLKSRGSFEKDSLASYIVKSMWSRTRQHGHQVAKMFLASSPRFRQVSI
ncbi:hypothetical protein TNCV_1927141 [Trichonephila clavipes]|nr:hypothetical protein TNCV_1927141 [Trichonephila clavipes]